MSPREENLKNRTFLLLSLIRLLPFFHLFYISSFIITDNFLIQCNSFCRYPVYVELGGAFKRFCRNRVKRSFVGQNLAQLLSKAVILSGTHKPSIFSVLDYVCRAADIRCD